MGTEIPRDGNVIRKKTKNFKIQISYNRNTIPVECKIKIFASKSRGNWNRHKMIQKIAEQPTGKAHHQGNAANSHIQDCAHTSESINLKVLTFITENNIANTHYT